ncbi:hypothetical protein D9611_013502 [Ephemerocybe angulata]|uniref:DUF6532 domain-containing protein n=1 Tax=Ephemerocybe angulata TaxID=980116 RepID=A0A8H5BV74_9AGAR|nr:hypothetical protein D9611_013502 [Tulosesus angulatus]
MVVDYPSDRTQRPRQARFSISTLATDHPRAPCVALTFAPSSRNSAPNDLHPNRRYSIPRAPPLPPGAQYSDELPFYLPDASRVTFAFALKVRPRTFATQRSERFDPEKRPSIRSAPPVLLLALGSPSGFGSKNPASSSWVVNGRIIESEDEDVDDAIIPSLAPQFSLSIVRRPQPQPQPELQRRSGTAAVPRPRITPLHPSSISKASVPHRPRAKEYGREDESFYSCDSPADDGDDDPVVHEDYYHPDSHPDLENFPPSSLPHFLTHKLSRTSPPKPGTSAKRKSTECDHIEVKRVKIIVPGPSGSRHCYSAADFEGLGKAILNDAITSFRVRCATQYPFPDKSGMRDERASQSWIDFCGKRELKMNYTTEPGWNVAASGTGQTKTVARPIEAMYGISSGFPKREVRDKVEALLDSISFVHENWNLPASLDPGRCQQGTDEGPTHAAFSRENQVPKPTVALVLTAIECVLDEWVSGEHVEVQFSANSYHAKYDQHIATLEAFDENTAEDRILPRLLEHILKVSRKHAKVIEHPASRKVTLSAIDFDPAKDELEGPGFI